MRKLVVAEMKSILQKERSDENALGHPDTPDDPEARK
jgi:hypothetical protein